MSIGHIKSFKADTLRDNTAKAFALNTGSDEGLMLEMEALKLFVMLNLHYQLSW